MIPSKISKKIDVHVCLAFVIILAATALRVACAILRWPGADADESVIQLMALHIDRLGEHPIFFYGQTYMGTLEAYIGALWFHIFGPSVLVMRLAMISLFVIFLIGLYILTSRLYARSFALLTSALLIFGTSKMIERQLGTIGGYTEILPLAVFLLLVSYILSVSEQPKNHYNFNPEQILGVAATTSGRDKPLPLRERSWQGLVSPYNVWWFCTERIILYVLWGLLAGLAFWSDFLIAPYILIAGILITIFCGKEILKWGLWLILLGFGIGAFPLIFYNLTATPGNDSWSTLIALNSMGSVGQDNLWHHVSRTLLVSIPIITGFQPASIITTWPSSMPHAFLHGVLQVGWSTGYLCLLCLSLLLGLLALKAARNAPFPRRAYAQATLHLLLILAAFLTIILYIKGGATNIDAFNGSRYLLIVWISTPAALWPLWRGIIQIRHLQKLRLALTAWRIGIIFMIFLVLCISTWNIFSGVASAQQTRQTTVLLTQKLENLHITRFFSEYWTCYPLIFASQEKLICTDTWANLKHGYDRYGPYRDAVTHANNPAFVYAVDSANLSDLMRALKATRTPYHLEIYVGYVIVQPVYAVPGVELYRP